MLKMKRKGGDSPYSIYWLSVSENNNFSNISGKCISFSFPQIGEYILHRHYTKISGEEKAFSFTFIPIFLDDFETYNIDYVDVSAIEEFQKEEEERKAKKIT